MYSHVLRCDSLHGVSALQGYSVIVPNVATMNVMSCNPTYISKNCQTTCTYVPV